MRKGVLSIRIKHENEIKIKKKAKKDGFPTTSAYILNLVEKNGAFQADNYTTGLLELGKGAI